jgi:hypothetical protein
MTRDEIIRKIQRDFKAWTSSLHLLMGQSVDKKDGYKLTRQALMNGVLDADLEGLLDRAVDGDAETEAVLCQMASILLYKLAETSLPPLKWFPKELAMLASSKLQVLANTPPSRHRGTNSVDTASRDYKIIEKVIEACKDLDLKPTRNVATGYRDSGCSIVAEALNLEESAVNEVWRKRKQFGFL